MLELPRSELVPHPPITIRGVTHYGWFEVIRAPKPRAGREWCSCSGDLAPGRSGPWRYFGPWRWHVQALISNG